MASEGGPAFAAALESASRLARREVDALLGKLDLDDPAGCKRALMVAYPAIVRKYGGVAAAAAAEFYQGERSGALGGRFSSLLAPPVDAGAIEAKLRYALRYLFGEAGNGE